MAALTRFNLLFEPKLLVRTSLMPAASTTARTATGDDAGSGHGGHEEHTSGPEFTDHRMRDGSALELDPVHLLVGVLDALLDGRGYLIGLAVTPGHLSPAVADDDQGIEAESPAALHHGRAAADRDHTFGPFTTVAISFSSVVDTDKLLRIADPLRGRPGRCSTRPWYL